MIANERQYQITKGQVARFDEALAQAEQRHAHLTPKIRQAMIDGIASQLADLREELAAYEALRDGRVRVMEYQSLPAIGTALIQARIAAGLSQEELGARLSVSRQQVQQDESQAYARASLSRLASVADALGVKFTERVEFPASPAPVLQQA
jgi:HTH-type transcriptional regulator / antitoxin HigA